ncbi:MAG: hypothetical protein CG438_1202 [Methylococcaceae bacterium NSP1-1]|nr:MAG: hypothetical protein CG438_1202 [Methylococcaceae bacterium NSP1-1]
MIQNKILVGLAALLLIGMTSVFTVSQTEKAIAFKPWMRNLNVF